MTIVFTRATLVILIFMHKMSFIPKDVHIKQKVRVEWVNDDTIPHNVVFKDIKSPYIYPGHSWSRSFPAKGKYEYYCEPHRSMEMTGSIIVE